MNIYIPSQEDIDSMKFEEYVPDSTIPEDAVFTRHWPPHIRKWTDDEKAEQSRKMKAYGNAWEVFGATEAARQANLGTKRSKECKEKLRKAALNRSMKTCPHCGKQSTSNNMSYWHFDNCVHRS